jgi:pantoate--beta-alanine ligase
MSSRNVRLSETARLQAPAMAKALLAAGAAIEAGQPVAAATDAAKVRLLKAGYSDVEYLELRDAETLEPVSKLDRPARLLAAAWIDGVRLIDNVAVLPGIGSAR